VTGPDDVDLLDPFRRFFSLRRDVLVLSLALFAFGLGFGVWHVAPTLGTVTVGGVALEPWIWTVVGLFLAQAWESFGLFLAQA